MNMNISDEEFEARMWGLEVELEEIKKLINSLQEDVERKPIQRKRKE